MKIENHIKLLNYFSVTLYGCKILCLVPPPPHPQEKMTASENKVLRLFVLRRTVTGGWRKLNSGKVNLVLEKSMKAPREEEI
jgi:hypothetical protein